MLGLGLRRLKTRPSLLDLIASQAVVEETASVVGGSRPSSPPAEELPPLPVSPTSTTSRSDTSCTTTSTTTTTATDSTDNLHHHGPNHLPSSSTSPPSTSTPSTHPVKMAPSAKDSEVEHGSVFSVSGPVVVAEHMIGCAMYELVRGSQPSECLGSIKSYFA